MPRARAYADPAAGTDWPDCGGLPDCTVQADCNTPTGAYTKPARKRQHAVNSSSGPGPFAQVRSS